MATSSSLSSFTCRRFASSDAASLQSFLTQQRLCGVKYSGGSDDTSTSSSSPSLFSARGARNFAHLRRWWGVRSAAEASALLLSHSAAFCVEDSAGLIAVAAFHALPNTVPLQGVGEEEDGDGPRTAPSPSSFPSWLPRLSCQSALSPAASTVSALLPSCTAFLSFLACASLANGRQERNVLDLVLHHAFHTMARTTHLALVQPRTPAEEGGAEDASAPSEAAPALQGTPLEGAFVAVSDGPMVSSSAPPLCVFVCRRSSHVPAVRVRRAVLEDHDDLLPLFERQTGLSAASCGPFFLAALVEPSAAASPSAPSLLSFLSSPTSVPLVAVVDGTAVGLLCLTAEVDTEQLTRTFDLDAFDQLQGGGEDDGDEDEEKRAQQEADEAESAAAALRDIYSLLYEATGQCPVGSRPASSTSTAGTAASNAMGGVESALVLDWLQLALQDSLAADAPSVSSAASAALSALLHRRPSPASLDCGQWVELWRNATAAVQSALGRRARPAVLRALWQRWVEAFKCRWRKSGPLSPSSPLLSPSASSAPSSAAFAVSCFVLDERYSSQAAELLLPAFAAFPALPYLLLSLPYDVATFPLLHSLTPVRRRRWTCETEAAYGYPHQLYLLHRTTALSLPSPAASNPALPSNLHLHLHVAEAQADDEAAVHRLLAHHAKAQRRAEGTGEEAAQLLSLQMRRWRAGLRPPSSPSSATAAPSPPSCLVVRCAGEVVGVVRTAPLQSAEQLTALHAHFDLEGVTGSPTPSLFDHRLLRLLLLNPLFDVHCPHILQEALRLSHCQALHYPVQQSDPSSPLSPSADCGSFHPLLLSSMQQRRPLTLPSSPLPSHVSRAALHFPSASQDLRSSPSPMAGKEAVAAFAPPGPPMAPLTSAEERRKCTACGDCECPMFALFSASFPSLCRPRLRVNSRVLVVGCGHTALAAVERLLMDDSVYLPHIQVLARYHPHLHEAEGDEGGEGERRWWSQRLLDGLLPSDLTFDRQRLRRLQLSARVEFVEGEVRHIDGQRRVVTFTPTNTNTSPGASTDWAHSPPHPPSLPCVLLFDELLLATGLQPSTGHLSVVLSPRLRLQDGDAAEESDEEGRGGRGRGGAGGAAETGGTVGTAEASHAVAASSNPLTASPSSSQSFSSPIQPPLQLLRSASDQQPALRSPPAPISDVAASSAASTRPPSAAPSGSERPLSAAEVNGVVRMGSEESAVQLLRALDQRRLLHRSSTTSSSPSPPTFSPSLRVVVSGSSLVALTVLAGLQQMGVSGESVVWVHPVSHVVDELELVDGKARHGAGVSLSWSVFEEEGSAALASVLPSLAQWRVRIVQQSRVTAVSADAALDLHSVTLSSGEVLSCGLLLLCDGAAVDEAVYACASRLGAVFDGRLVVNDRCLTRIPHVRAAGPVAKFQRRLSGDGSGGAQLHHSAYHSESVGRWAASALLDALTAAAASTTSAVFSIPTAPLPSSLQSRHRAVYGRLPGSLGFLHCWEPSVSSSPALSAADGAELCLTQTFPSYGFSLSYAPSSLRVVRLRYWGEWEVPAESLQRLIGVPLTYCNRLLHRWAAGQIRHLLLFVQQDWAALLHSNAFTRTRQQLVRQLTEEHAEHMRPLLLKLSHFLTRHRQTMRGDGGGESSDLTQAESGTSSLLSMVSFLPLHFRDSAHRALLHFLDSQRPLLPSTLQQPTPFFDSPANSSHAMVAAGTS